MVDSQNLLPLSTRIRYMLTPKRLYARIRARRDGRKGEPELRLLPFLVSPGGTAIDGGANRGVYSTCLSPLCQTVHAFEPNPAMNKYLRSAAPANVTVSNQALSDQKGTAEFSIPIVSENKLQHTGGSLNSVDQSDQAVTFSVETTTIDELGFTNVSLIKLDLEGFEYQALRGGIKTIQRDKPVLIIEIHPDLGAATRDDLINEMISWEYLPFVLDHGKLVTLDFFLRTGQTRPASHNFIFLSR
ncbi:FkbM family methyltransferase [bacterium]|jgi:FkbM family methyltransferase|nr:FkbM family methyltransferase [bacterium]